MKLYRIHLISAIAIFIMILSAALPAQEITFTFDPPDSGSVIINSTMIDTMTYVGGQMTSRRTYSTKVDSYKTDTNIIMVNTILNSEKYIDDQLQDESELGPVVGLQLTFYLDFDGHLDSLGGWEAYRDSILKYQSTETSQYFPQYYDYVPFFILVSTEWNNQLGVFIGRTVNIGDSLILTDTIENIDGIQYVTRKFRFTDLVDYGGLGMAGIDFEYSSDKEYSDIFADSLASFLARSFGASGSFKLEILKDHIDLKGRELLQPEQMGAYYINRESLEIMTLRAYGGMDLTIQLKRIEEHKCVFNPEDI